MGITTWRSPDTAPKDKVILLKDGNVFFTGKYIDDPYMPHEMPGYFVEVFKNGIHDIHKPVVFDAWMEIDTARWI